MSPSGVRLFAEKFNPGSFKIAVIGPGTEAAVVDCGWTVDFTPKSTDPTAGIAEFAESLSANETVIMACSDKSLKRMRGAVPDSQLIEWEFYENAPAPHIPKTDADYLVFTSPSNADAYLDAHELAANQTAVAIGKTTDAALEKRGVGNRIRAEHPVEEWIWQAVWTHRLDLGH